MSNTRPPGIFATPIPSFDNTAKVRIERWFYDKDKFGAFKYEDEINEPESEKLAHIKPT